MDINKCGKWIVGVFKEPSKTLNEIEREKPIREGIYIVFIFICFELMLGIFGSNIPAYSSLFGSDFGISILILFFVIVYIGIKLTHIEKAFISIFCVISFAIIPWEVGVLLLKIVVLLSPPVTKDMNPMMLIVYIPTIIIAIVCFVHSTSIIISQYLYHKIKKKTFKSQ